jgi:UDP-N-acetylmuramate--alanine ligase
MKALKPTERSIHFVGIGGAGMSAIAEILHRQGHAVSGSDQVESETTRRLAALGLKVRIGHDAAHVGLARTVVTSTAVRADNPEVVAAHARAIPVMPRAAMLAELMRRLSGVAIAGTHGKTTTTSLVASVLMEAGVDPTFIIGGTLTSAAANAHLGKGPHIVVEADESDASFLHLGPLISVVTNIDADHMETYGHDLGRLRRAFVDFLHRLPPDGHAILCSDDPGVQAILPRVERPVIRYGLEAGAEVRAVDVVALAGGGMRFVAQRQGASDLPVTLNLAGLHNVRNALAALAVAQVLKLPDAPVQSALAGFAGVGRRFERRGEVPAAGGGYYTLIDDYGHHPAEIAAVLAAARGAFPGRRLVLAFQPHRYSRTRDCFEGFVDVLARFDALLLTEVYAAGEAPIAGAEGRNLSDAIAARDVLAPRFVPAVADLPAEIQAASRDGDVVLTMGAGSIGRVPAQLLELTGGAR